MKIIFIGTVDFSYSTLKEILDNNANVIGIFTKKQSSFNSDYKDLTPLAKKYDIPIFYVNDINSEESYNTIKSLKPDIAFCFGWSQLIGKKIIDIPPKGVIGVHPAELPYNRGRHPIIWSLFLGLTKSAVTFFKINEGIDTGSIVSQVKFDITYEDDAKSIYEKIKDVAKNQISEFLPKLEEGNAVYKRQNMKKGNYWRKRDKLDGKIDWRMSKRAIYNLVRALTKPYVGAHCIYNNKEIKIWSVKEKKNTNKNIEPGKVLKSDGESINIKVYDGAIELIEHEFEELPKKGEYL